jgi:hypothetical protein
MPLRSNSPFFSCSSRGGGGTCSGVKATMAKRHTRHRTERRDAVSKKEVEKEQKRLLDIPEER